MILFKKNDEYRLKLTLVFLKERLKLIFHLCLRRLAYFMFLNYL